jgi:hypothetical protein
MSQVSGTTDTFRVGTAGGLREDLEDVIWDLFAEDTFLLNKLEKVDADGTYHEWLTDALVAPTANRQIEGDDAAFVTIASPTRVGNYQQISRKTFLVSGTLEKVSKAGRKSEAARQLMKQMRELKNEMEYALIRNQASSTGGSATGRSSAGMESWIADNEILSTTTASATTPGFASGVVAAPTDGSTTAALTIAALNSALESAWVDGGDPSVVLCDPTQKKVIDGFTGIATRNIDVAKGSQAQIINAAGVYVSSFGVHTVKMHRFVRSSVVLCIDPEYWAISFLRRPFKEKLAKTGDGDKHMILTEFGLVSRNEKASAKIVALV